MANSTSTSTITRAQALAAAIALFAEDAPEREVLGKMLTSITKPRAKDTSTATKNAALVAEVCELFKDVDAFQNADVRAAVDGIEWLGSKGTVSPQKVTAVLRQGVAEGKITKETIGTGSSALTFYTVV